MQSDSPICPHCGSAARQTRAGRNPSGSQRWVCRTCGRRFTSDPGRIGYPPEFAFQAVRLCLEGQSFRAVARQLRVSPQSVSNWVSAHLRRASRVLYRLPRK